MSVNGSDSIWSDERISALRTMHEAGEKFEVIGAALGISKNSCIGKARRLGLSLRRMSPSSQLRPNKKRTKVAPKPKAEPQTIIRIVRAGYGTGLRVATSVKTEMPAFSCIEAEPLNKTLIELGPNDCKYIAGDPRDGAIYCGHPVFMRSYCAGHFARCYVEPLKRWSVAA